MLSPATSSYSSTPTAQWSSASDAEPSRSTSGATYGSVPHCWPVRQPGMHPSASPGGSHTSPIVPASAPHAQKMDSFVGIIAPASSTNPPIAS